MTNPKTASQAFNQAAKAFAQSLAIELVPSFVETAAEIERAIEAFARVPNGGLLVLPDLTLVAHRDLVIALATRYRLPAIYEARFWVAAGGLMSYGTDRIMAYSAGRAVVVDRILHGEQPGDLPVQGPTRFETTLNLRAAKALNLAIPPGLLVAADEVIEWGGRVHHVARRRSGWVAARGAAQRPNSRIAHIAYLGVSSPSALDPRQIEQFKQGLAENGLVEDRDVTVDYLWAEGSPERLRELAASSRNETST